MSTLSLAIDPPIQQGVYDRIISRIPDGRFYGKAPITIPYSSNPTAFTLKTVYYGPSSTVHRVSVNGVLQDTVIPEKESTRVLLQLPHGPSTILVDNGIEHVVLLVNTSHLGTILSGIAKEIFISSRLGIDEGMAALKSPFSSRLIEHHLVFQDLLPSNRAPRIHAAKMAIRAMLSAMGTDQGVKDFATALTYQTPIFEELRNTRSDFNPKIYPILRDQVDFGGFEVHVWLPNLCMFSWVTLIRLADNVGKPFALKSVSEEEVVLEFDGVESRHAFDADAEECIDSLSQLISCFDNIRSWVETTIVADYATCAAAYPLDVLVELPLGIGVMDLGDTDDDGDMDVFDEIDPAGNGYEDESLVNRFDGGHCLDSLGVTQAVEDLECCWEGHAVAAFWNNDTTIDIEVGDQGLGF